MTDDDAQILRLPAVQKMVGLKKSAIYRAAADGSFPKPVRLLGRATGWRKGEVIRWLQDRPTISQRGA